MIKALIFILISSSLLAAELNVTTKFEEPFIKQNTPFNLLITVDSKESLDSYVFELPQIALPEGFAIQNTNQSSQVSSEGFNVIYTVQLISKNAGDFVLEPIKLEFKKSGIKNELTTEKVPIAVSKSSLLAVKTIYLVFAGIAVIILLTGLIILFVIKRRNRISEPIQETKKTNIEILLNHKISGNHEAFLKEAKSIVENISPKHILLNEINLKLNNALYAGYKPTKEEIENIFITLEKELEQ